MNLSPSASQFLVGSGFTDRREEHHPRETIGRRHDHGAGGSRTHKHQGLSLAALPICVPRRILQERDHGESNPELRIDNARCCRYTMAPYSPILGDSPRASLHISTLAREGFEPSASLVLSESGLPVAYRAFGRESAQGGIRTPTHPVLSRAARPIGVLGRTRATDLVGQFRGLESNQRPPRSERGVATNSHYPGVTSPRKSRVREGGLEPPPPDSKSGSLPVSRFPRASCGSRTRLSGLGSPCLNRSAKDAVIRV